MQNIKWSAIESFINVFIGFLIAQLLILYLLPLWDSKSLTLKDSIQISAIFTSISFIRGFIFRRLFNKVHKK
jgi:hypothetical protein